jgi:hypothetical protein
LVQTGEDPHQKTGKIWGVLSCRDGLPSTFSGEQERKIRFVCGTSTFLIKRKSIERGINLQSDVTGHYAVSERYGLLNI